MKLKSFGCSFVYGTDLDDAATHGHGASSLSWPALLAQRMGLEYECHAFPGIGNLQILQRLLTALNDPDPAVYVVSWTWIDRFDYQHNDEWQTIRPTSHEHTAKFYYKDLHSQLRDQITTLSYMATAVTMLQAQDLPFVFVCMDDLVLENRWRTQNSIKLLQGLIEPCVTTFDGENFLSWSRRQGYAVSDQLHPLAPAHQAAADYVWNTLSWQHNES